MRVRLAHERDSWMWHEVAAKLPPRSNKCSASWRLAFERDTSATAHENRGGVHAHPPPRMHR
eukprot:3349965-Alexandrium_andersonii.AAC.1